MKHLIFSLLIFACTALSHVNAQSVNNKPLLDVSIKTFTANLPNDIQLQQAQGIYPAVRQAESRYLPSYLKLILEESALFGALSDCCQMKIPGQNYRFQPLLIHPMALSWNLQW